MRKRLSTSLVSLFIITCLWPYLTNAKHAKSSQSTTQQVMDEIYKDLSGFKRLGKREHKDIVDQGGYPIYGEITHGGFKTILDDIKPTQKDQFFDLGSGAGKVAIQAYLDTPMKVVKGVELSTTRYETAQKAYERLKEKGLLDRKRKLVFLHDNILDVDLAGTTIAYTCSTCFDLKLMHAIMELLAKLKPGLIVLTLQELPKDYPDYGFEFVKKYTVPMTWDTENVYRYVLTKKGEPSAPHKKTPTKTTKKPKEKSQKSNDTFKILDETYEDISGFKRLGKREHKDLVEHGAYPTYGEITKEGVKILLDDVAKTVEKKDKKHQKEVFYDLGTGVGKIPVQGFLDYDWIVKSVGIELSPTRYKGAAQALERLKEQGLLKDKNRKLAFIEGNILDEDTSDATLVYAGSTCYSPELMRGIMEKLSKNKKGLILFTLQELPENYKDYGFEMTKEYKKVPMTWDTESVFRYELIGKSTK